MSLRQEVEAAVRGGEIEALEALVAAQPRSLRFLVGMSYHQDLALRQMAARTIGLAARHHPKLMRSVVQRLISAMRHEAGGNGVTAPEVLRQVAEVQPELLLPFVPDLLELAADPSLHAGLAATLSTIAARCPGEVGSRMGRSIATRQWGAP